jgi:plastocyanin
MHLGLSRRLPFAILLFAVCIALGPHRSSAEDKAAHLQVIVPEEDRFTPFAQTIHVGDAVKWINMDTDDHTVVSDDFLNTTGRFGLNVLLKGTDNNGGKPGTFSLRFTAPGTFVYYCRFHSHLDAHHQPTAPGPDGGIQADDGNFGTPMMGVITVLP